MSIPNPGFPRPGAQYDLQNESQFRAAVQAVISALDAEIQGDTAILAEHDIVGANHTAEGLTTGHVLQATGATTFGWQPLDFTDLAGSIADAQVPETAVTQHEAALTILETQITDGALLARVGGNETITGSWTFTDGTVTFDPGNAQSWIDINTDLANYCGIHFQHNNLTAFEVSVDNGTNNFYIYRWNPDGTRLGPEIAIAQATGKVTISNDLDITGFNVGLTGINSHTAPTATGSQLLVRDLNDNGLVKVITPPTANGTSYYLRFNSSASGFTWQPVDFASPSVNETITGLWDFSGIIDFGEGITVSNGSNWYIDATQNTWIEINPTADGSAYTGGWARYIGWNAGGGGTPPEVQMGVLGGTASVTYLYLTANATRGTGHYNLANTLRIKPDDPFWYDGTAERRLTYDDSASNFTMTGIWTFDRINVNSDSYFYGTTTARYLWFDLGNGVTPQNGGFGWRDNGANEWLFRMDTGLNLEVYNYNVAATVTQWDSATGDLQHSRDLYLTDATQYPVGSLLYVGTAGLIEGAGAPTQYDIPFRIDSGAWSYISTGANPDGSVLLLSSGIPQWGSLTAAQADSLYKTQGGTSYEDGDYFLALSNATGTLGVTKIQLLAESTVIIGGSLNNETRALTYADISDFNTGVDTRLDISQTITNLWTFNNGADFLGDITRRETGANGYIQLSAGDGVSDYIAGLQLQDNDVLRYMIYKSSSNQFAIAAYTSSAVYDYAIMTATEGTGSGSGTVSFGSNLVTIGGGLRLNAGSAGVPAIQYTSDTNTGFYFPGTARIGVTINGTQHVEFDGAGIELVSGQIRPTAIYDEGDESGNTLNVNWDNGQSQRCTVNTGNATINMNSTGANQGASYTMEVTNVNGSTGRTVTWTGISQWVGSAPTATIDAGKMTVVQTYVARNRAGTNYVIGSVILDNVTVPT